METPELTIETPTDPVSVLDVIQTDEPTTEIIIGSDTGSVTEPISDSVITTDTITTQETTEVVSDIPKVVQNSDVLYKSDIQWYGNIEYAEPNSYEIEMLHGTKKPKELLEEEQSEEIVLKTEEEIKKQKTKDLLLIFKVVSLHRLGYHPIQNTSSFQPMKLKEFLDMMNALIEDYNKGLEIEITAEFNKICNDVLFFNHADVSQYPVYSH